MHTLRAAALTLLVAVVAAVGASPTAAQSRLRGTVTDAETGRPLSNVNVFLAGTTRGTTTDEQGQFALTALPAGSQTIVASIVGYESKQVTVLLKDPRRTAVPPVGSLTFELSPEVIELEGVTVEDSREEWLDRLEQFRSAFFGDGPYAEACEFVNPEVLSLDEQDGTLVAHTERPLRVRNDALGYEMTYYGPRYVVSSSNLRSRYGAFRFTPLSASGPAERARWSEARAEAYRGSFRHFVDALVADALREENFWVRLVSGRPDGPMEAGRRPGRALSDVSEIVEVTDSLRTMVLSLPSGERLRVRYTGEEEHSRFARRYRGRAPRSYQLSRVAIEEGTKVLIDTKSGDFLRRQQEDFGYYVLTGYWGWSMTAAAALPANYRPPAAPQ